MSTKYVIAQSNRGTDFWLGFMEHIDISSNTKVLMITSEKNTSGTIYIPKQNWSSSYTVIANTITSIVLPATAQANGSETTGDEAIHITALDTIVVYAHQYSSKRSEAAIILPTDVLGTEYYAMMYTGTDDNNGKASPSEFLAVAAYDSTTLTIKVSDDTKGGHASGATFSVMISKGQTYEVQSLTGNNGDLTGSYITADKPFALFGGDRWTAVGGCKAMDNIYEEMYPVDTWGKKYIISRTKGRPNQFDIVRIIASVDNTNVYVDGTFVKTLNKGSFYEYSQYNDGAYVSADQPIMVAQFITGSGCASNNNLGDPSMILANPIGQTVASVTFYASPYEAIDSNYINIIASTADTASILLDGATISSYGYRFTPVSALSDYSYVYLKVNVGVHNIDGGTCGITGIVYGFGFLESYGYSLGATYKNLTLDIAVSSCTNDTYNFTASTGDSIATYEWDFGDGSTSSDENPSHAFADTGYYTVSLNAFTSTFCTNDSVTNFLIVHVDWIDSVTSSSIDETCFGKADGSITVQPYGGISPYAYQWNDALSQTSQTVSNLSQGTYIVVVRDSGGCSFSQSVDVKSPTEIIATMSDTTLFCGTANGKITVSVSGGWPSVNGYDYLWNDSASQTTQTASGLSSGNYTVVIKDSTGCEISDSLLINVFSIPLIDAGNDLAICKGNSIKIGGSPSGTKSASYLWSPSTGLNDSTLSNVTSNASSSITYYLLITDTTTCTNLDSMRLTVYDLPIANAGNDTTICKGDSIHLIASGANTYQWQNNTSLSDTSIGNPKVYPIVATTYYVTATDTNNCSANDSVKVIPQSVTITVGTSQWVCEGTPTTLFANGAINYTWFPSTYLNDSTSATPISTPTDSVTYLITGYDALGCADNDSLTLIVNRIVPTDAGIDHSICPGSIITIGGNPTSPGGTTYLWTPTYTIDDTSAANPNVNPDTSLFYTVVTAFGTLCSGKDSVKVNVFSLPIVDAGTDQQMCYGDSAQLNALGAALYTWTPISNVNNSSIGNPIVYPDSSAMYYVLGTDTNGCSNTDSLEIVIFALPLANAGNDNGICVGDSCQLTASGGIKYLWQSSNSLSSDTVFNPIAQPDTSTTYIVLVTDSNNCKAKDSVFVRVNPLPSIDAGKDIETCINDSISLSATYNLFYRYNWYPSYGLSDSTVYNPFVFTQSNTQYYLSVTDSNNCKNVDSISISINALPEAAFSFTLTPSCEGMLAEFSNQTTNADSYLWDFGDGQFSTEKDPEHTFTQNGNSSIMLIASNEASCADTIIISNNTKPFIDYLTIKIADVFTPNNDGINDVFLQDIDPSLWDCVELKVFNRWGKIIYSSEQGPTWDGNTKAAIAAGDDTYLYILKVVDYEVKGTLKLLR